MAISRDDAVTAAEQRNDSAIKLLEAEVDEEIKGWGGPDSGEIIRVKVTSHQFYIVKIVAQKYRNKGWHAEALPGDHMDDDWLTLQ